MLFSEAAEADKPSLIKKVQQLGYSELLIPNLVFSGAKIPVLASGKIDYVSLEAQVKVEREAEVI